MVRRWCKENRKVVTAVRPGTEVFGQILDSEELPGFVEVRRFHEPIVRRVISKLTGEPTTPETTLSPFGDSNKYGPWDASVYSTRSMTRWVFREQDVGRRSSSGVLSVFSPIGVTRKKGLHGTLGPTIDGVGAEFGGEIGTELEYTVDASHDPDVNVFLLTPHGDGERDLNAYLDTYLEEIAGRMRDHEDTFEAGEQFVAEFHEEYSPFTQGPGHFEISAENETFHLEAGESSIVTLRIKPQEEGNTLFAVGCNWSDGENEGSAISDLVALSYPAVAMLP